jgi:hypothetical protein
MAVSAVNGQGGKAVAACAFAAIYPNPAGSGLAEWMTGQESLKIISVL